MSPIPFYSINGSSMEGQGIDDTNSDDCDFFLTGANNTISIAQPEVMTWPLNRQS
jgi:hypothetical protein